MSEEPNTTAPRAYASSASHSQACAPQSTSPSIDLRALEGEITCMSLNEKATRLAVGTTCGYFVYDINRRRLLFSKDFGKAVGLVELLGNTNLVILSGHISGECSVEPLVDTKTLLFWNDETVNKQTNKK